MIVPKKTRPKENKGSFDNEDDDLFENEDDEDLFEKNDKPTIASQYSSGFLVLPKSAARDHQLANAPFRCLSALAAYADIEGKCWPSVMTLAQDLGIQPRTVQKHLRELEYRGYIQRIAQYRDSGGQTSNLYKILDP